MLIQNSFVYLPHDDRQRPQKEIQYHADGAGREGTAGSCDGDREDGGRCEVAEGTDIRGKGDGACGGLCRRGK